MKKIGIFIALVFGLFISLGALLWFTNCGACITQQDIDFMNKVKAELKEVGDTVKVSDIHSGDWVEVCASDFGYEGDIKKMYADSPEDVVIINSASTRISSTYDNSAIIFKYEGNKFEIYHMTPDKISYEPSQLNSNDCLKNSNSYFHLISDRRVQIASERETK